MKIIIEIPAPAAVAHHGQPFVIIPGPEVLRLNDHHAGVVNEPGQAVAHDSRPAVTPGGMGRKSDGIVA